MLGYTRRQVVLLSVVVGVAAGGLGIDRWRRGNPDTAAYLETLDRAPAPPPAVREMPRAAPGRTRAAEPGHPLRAASARTRERDAEPPAPLDVNRASAEEFERLPGVGPVLAARIVDTREREGPFGSVDDLRRVRGVGRATLERLRPLLAVETP